MSVVALALTKINLRFPFVRNRLRPDWNVRAQPAFFDGPVRIGA